jgi:RNA polymerase sigma-70 factor (ECF subfamily)
MNVPARNPAQDDDESLIVRVASRDRRALDSLYLSYHRRLARFLCRVTRRYENVEEIINDTFMVVWQSAGQFQHASRVSTWIFGIAYRTALKSIRRQKHHSATASSESCSEPSWDPAHATETLDWLAQGLNQLSIEHRLTLELAYRMGHSMEEIAVITEVPVGTVKARMFHAREKLRRHLPILGGDAVEHG